MFTRMQRAAAVPALTLGLALFGVGCGDDSGSRDDAVQTAHETSDDNLSEDHNSQAACVPAATPATPASPAESAGPAQSANDSTQRSSDDDRHGDSEDVDEDGEDGNDEFE